MGLLKKEVKKSIEVMQLPVARITVNPKQPRKKFSIESLMSLSESIRQNGILQPLTVRLKSDGDYELVAGERRLRAALMAGFVQVPCIEVVLDDTQSAVMALIENIQREDLNCFEEAEGIAKLIEYCGLTQDEVARRLGRKQSTIANKLRLLRFTENERDTILCAGLTERHARALLKLDGQERAEALEDIIKNDLNVAESERLIEAITSPQQEKGVRRNLPIVKDVRLFFNTINNAIDLMKKSGIDASAQRQEYDEYFEYIVKIPKTAAASAAASEYRSKPVGRLQGRIA